MNVTYICPNCGSDNVRTRLWCVWDAYRQRWADDDDDHCAAASCANCDWNGTYADLIKIPAKKGER